MRKEYRISSRRGTPCVIQENQTQLPSRGLIGRADPKARHCMLRSQALLPRRARISGGDAESLPFRFTLSLWATRVCSLPTQLPHIPQEVPPCHIFLGEADRPEVPCCVFTPVSTWQLGRGIWGYTSYLNITFRASFLKRGMILPTVNRCWVKGEIKRTAVSKLTSWDYVLNSTGKDRTGKVANKLVSIKRKKEERGGSPGILEDAGTQESMCTAQGNPYENQKTARHSSTFPEGHLVPLSEPQ